MKAAVIDRLGAAPHAVVHPDPPPATGDQVLVKVEAAALNAVDLHVASGRHRAGAPQLPYVPGIEAVGTVVAGPDQGLRVRAVVPAGLPGVNGGMAEFLLTDRATCIPVPDGLDSAAAAAIGVVGTSADMSLRRAGMRAGESVLVLGASGPLGTAFVQLARLGGAKRVIAAGRDPERLAQVRGRRRRGGTRRRAAIQAAGFPRRAGGPGRGSGVGSLGRAGAGLPEARRALPERRRGGRRRDGIPRRAGSAPRS